MPWSSDIPATYLPCTWPGSQRRRPAPQRAGTGPLAHPRYTPGTPAVNRRAETSAVWQLEPGHHPPAAPPPAPPRREARNKLKPPAAFRIAARRAQPRRPRPGAISDLDSDDAVPCPDRDRDRLPRSTRTAVPDRITEDLADQQDGHIPARVPGAEYLTDEPAGGTRPLRSPGKRHGLPDRYPSHQCTRLPGRPRPGKRAGRRADTPDARPTRRRASSRHTPPARPVRAVRGRPSGYADRPTGTKPVRYASVDGAI